MGSVSRAHPILSWSARGRSKYQLRASIRVTKPVGVAAVPITGRQQYSSKRSPSSNDTDLSVPATAAAEEKACPCSLPSDGKPKPAAKLMLDDSERSRLDDLVSNGRWSFTPPPETDTYILSKEFLFKGFKKAFKFMTLVAADCDKQKHHPEWTNAYNKVMVHWTTHRPRGLTGKDIAMAEACDRHARECGEEAKG